MGVCVCVFCFLERKDDIMSVAPRRYVKPLEPAVVAGRDELDALSQIKNFEVQYAAVIYYTDMIR